MSTQLQPTNQPTNKPINQTFNQSIYQSINQLTNQLILGHVNILMLGLSSASLTCLFFCHVLMFTYFGWSRSESLHPRCVFIDWSACLYRSIEFLMNSVELGISHLSTRAHVYLKKLPNDVMVLYHYHRISPSLCDNIHKVSLPQTRVHKGPRDEGMKERWREGKMESDRQKRDPVISLMATQPVTRLCVCVCVCVCKCISRHPVICVWSHSTAWYACVRSEVSFAKAFLPGLWSVRDLPSVHALVCVCVWQSGYPKWRRLYSSDGITLKSELRA